MDNSSISGSIKESLQYYENPASEYFDPNMNYYICSYGGSGSSILYKYLSNFGRAYHIHSRYPPFKLKYTGSLFSSNPVRNEWFNDVDIPEDQLKKYKVIFIYRNPIHSIYSSFINTEFERFIGTCREHIINIQASYTGEIHLLDVVKNERDLYGIENFYDNYTRNNITRNYNIICVKYEDFFEKIGELNKVLEIPDSKILYPVKKENTRPQYYYSTLLKIYYPLLKKMEKMNSIEVI